MADLGGAWAMTEEPLEGCHQVREKRRECRGYSLPPPPYFSHGISHWPSQKSACGCQLPTVQRRPMDTTLDLSQKAEKRSKEANGTINNRSAN